MRFNPSPYSYGYGDGEASALEPTAAPAAPAPESSDYTSYIPLVGGLVRQVLGVSDDPEEIKAKIANYEQMMLKAPASPAGFPLPGTKNWYQNEINKLYAKLKVAEEEKAKAQFQDVLKFAAIVGGVVLVGGLAVNQIMRARIQRVELAKLKESL